jgi:hypothetical protein
LKSSPTEDILSPEMMLMSTPRRDQRKRERRSCSLYMRFVNIQTGEAVGDLADISREGFRLESLKPIPLNAQFTFRIDLSPEISTKPFIVVTAQSRWSLPDRVDGRLYDTGFEIMKIAPGDTQAFELIIDRYGSSSTGRF